MYFCDRRLKGGTNSKAWHNKGNIVKNSFQGGIISPIQFRNSLRCENFDTVKIELQQLLMLQLNKQVVNKEGRD